VRLDQYAARLNQINKDSSLLSLLDIG